MYFSYFVKYRIEGEKNIDIYAFLLLSQLYILSFRWKMVNVALSCDKNFVIVSGYNQK